jgi:hypothetical protein
MITETNTFISEAIPLLHNSGFKQFEDVTIGKDLVGSTAVVRPLHVGNMLVSYLIGERDTYRDLAHEMIVSFKRNLKKAFNDNDLKALCFDLNIPYEDLGSDTHNGRIQDLIEYGQRHGRLAELTAYCRQHRPHLVWPDFPIVQSVSMKTKEELAVVVCINQLALQPAADYLSTHQIDCTYLLLTTVPDYSGVKWLPKDDDWSPAVQDFYLTMQKVLKARRHFFFAAPLPYVFAIGCAWSLVNDGDELYHWDGSQYVHVMTSSRQWKG